MSREFFDKTKGEAQPKPTLLSIVNSHLTAVVSERADFIATLPPEHSASVDEIPAVRIFDARIRYINELLAVIRTHNGFDSSEQTVLYIKGELAKMSQILEDLARENQQYGYSPTEDPSDLLRIQIDLTGILEKYTASRQ
jgi:hypothetical protein